MSESAGEGCAGAGDIGDAVGGVVVVRVKFGQRIYIEVGRRDVQWVCIGGSDDRGDQGNVQVCNEQ